MQGLGFFLYFTGLDGLEGGSHFARAKCFALRHLGNAILTAKQTIDNRLAGRAAKGASPTQPKKRTLNRVFFFYFPH